METSTKIGIIGAVASLGLSATFGIIEISDRRNGRKRIHKEDIRLIAEGVVDEIEERDMLHEERVNKILKGLGVEEERE